MFRLVKYATAVNRTVCLAGRAHKARAHVRIRRFLLPQEPVGALTALDGRSRRAPHVPAGNTNALSVTV